MKNMFQDITILAHLRISVLLLIAFPAFGQTLTDPWATLANGAGPYEVAVDAPGNVYTTNRNNRTVSKITASGHVTPNWATLAAGSEPTGIAIAPNGDVFVANSGTHSIAKITSLGTVTENWFVAPMQKPFGLAIDNSNNLYATLLDSSKVVKIDPNGVLLQTYPVTHAPFALDIDRATGTVYVAHQDGPGIPNRITKITATDQVVTSWFQIPNAGFVDIMVDGDGNVFTANIGANTISRITRDGVATPAWASIPSGGVARLTRDLSNNVFVANNSSNTVKRFSPTGIELNSWQLSSGASLIGIVFHVGKVYVANHDLHTVSKIDFRSVPASGCLTAKVTKGGPR
jgi:tripartite motif-containing protein 71